MPKLGMEPIRRAALVKATIDCIRCETEWEARTGPLCDWCEFREVCPAF